MSDDTAEGGSAKEGLARRDKPADAPEAGATPGSAETGAAEMGAAETGSAEPESTETELAAVRTPAAPPAEAAPPPPPSAAPSPAPSPTPAPAAKRGGGCAGVLWTLVVVALIAVGGFFTRATWWPLVEPHVGGLLPATAAGGSELAAKVEGVLADQASLRQSLTALAGTVKGVEDKLAAIESRVDGLAGRIEAPQPTPAAATAATAAGTAPGAGQPAVTAAITGISQKAEALGRQTETLVKQTETLSRQTETLAKETLAVGSKAETLAGRIDELARRTEGVEAQLAPLAEAPAAAKALLPRVDALEADSLQTKRLADRFREVETASKETVGRAQHLAASVLAIQQLKAALAASGPFAAQLASAQALARDDADLAAQLAVLDPLAAQGIPSVAILNSRFGATAAAVSRAALATAGESWGERALDRLSALVTIRRVGPAALAAGGTEGALAQAEEALTAGDLAGALAALEGVQGPGAEALQPWLAAARARLAADKAIAEAEGRAIARLREARG